MEKIKYIFSIPFKEELSEDDYRHHIVRRFFCILLIWYVIIFIILFITKEPYITKLLALPYLIPLTVIGGRYYEEGYVLVRNKYFYISVLIFLFTVVLVQYLLK